MIMAKPTVFLEYYFLFEADSTTFVSIYDFERELGKFFKERNLLAELMEPIKGQVGRRIVKLTPTDKLDQMAQGTAPKPKQVVNKSKVVKL
jgi:hypothetical protein